MDLKNQTSFDFSAGTKSKSNNNKPSNVVRLSVISITEKIESKKKDYEISLYSRIIARAKHLL